MNRIYPILLSLFLLIILACSDGGDPVGPGDGGDGGGNGGGDDSTAVSFAADILPVLTSTCASVGCHAPETRSGGLALDEANAYDDLVGVVSSGYAPAVRVEPGDPDSSVLYQKLLGAPAFGARMPLGGAALPSDDLEAIREWIEEGAKDD